MKRSRLITVIIISIIGIFLSILISLAFGSRRIPLNEVIQILATINDMGMNDLNRIVIMERIPRTIFALVAGGALGVSGALMQSLTRNPIADPSILGVNTGASLAVVIGIAVFNIGTLNSYIWFSLIGAIITAFFVYSIGSLGVGGATPIKLALAGTVTSAALSSIVGAIVLTRTAVMNQFRFWQVGSISGATWEGLYTITPFILVGLVLAFASSKSLDALALGEELATGLGARVGVIKIISAISGILLCGAVTALAGPIGFVGLMVPHTARLLLGSSLKHMIPFSFIGGAIVLVCADVIGRLIGSPGELEAGIVTAFIGAPILIYIAMKAKVTAL